jgi:hypothetical protein
VTALEGVAARALALSKVSFTAAAMLSRTCLRDRCVMSVFTVSRDAFRFSVTFVTALRDGVGVSMSSGPIRI